MSTRHRPPMRTQVAMLLFMLVLACVDARETIYISSDVTLASQTLAGTVLDVSAAGSWTAPVNILLQRCTVETAGLTVSGATSSSGLHDAMTLHILDTTVKDATLTFRDYIPINSDVRVVNVTATMEGSTPLFDLRNLRMGWYSGEFRLSSMTIRRVRATWGTGDGGSVVQMVGFPVHKSINWQTLSFSEAVVTGAAHVLEITSTVRPDGQSNDNCLSAFDLIEFRDARGAFIYSDTTGITLSSRYYGMTRFSNITMTGGQPFFEARKATQEAVYNDVYGSMVFSAISNDGPLFSLVTDADIIATTPNAKYSFRHINVGSVMSTATSYGEKVPKILYPNDDETWNFYMGNITVAGKLLKTILELAVNDLYATHLVGAYGEVIEVRDVGLPMPSIGTAAAVNCVSATGVTAGFVELAPGVQRAECECPSNYNNTPYCTTAVDPLVYYDAYSPSPATCDVANCDSCLFGQTSQCGACALGYMLTSELGCEIIPCKVANCKGCSANNVCGLCAKGYKVNTKGHCNLLWWVWLIVGIAAASVVAGIIVLVVCCVRRHRSKAEESSSSMRASSNKTMRRDKSDTTEMQQYGSLMDAGTALPNRSAPSGAYEWSLDDCNAARSTQGSRASFANPLDYDYQ